MRILNNFKSSMAGIMLSLSRYPIVIIWLMAVKPYYKNQKKMRAVNQRASFLI